MPKRMLVVSLITGLAAAFLTSCGGYSSPPVAGKGTVFALVGDAPLCDVLSFRTTITGLTLTPTGGGSPVNVVNPSTASIKVNFASLRDFSTILNFASVPAGTYSQATLAFSFGQIVVYDPT